MDFKMSSSRWSAAAAAIAVWAAAVATGAGPSLAEDEQAKTLSLGGRLYDNLWAVRQKRPPAGRNPLYPSTVTREDGDTWRCAWCHGWDYAGSSGHLGRDHPDAVFVRLIGRTRATPDEIAARLVQGSHKPMVEPLPPTDRAALAAFLAFGLHDATSLIAPDGTARGEAKRGQPIYEGACVTCHTASGAAPIFGEAGDVPSLGWIARNRPEQALHKIRNGVAHADMLSLRTMALGDLGDLLAYLQTLEKH